MNTTFSFVLLLASFGALAAWQRSRRSGLLLLCVGSALLGAALGLQEAGPGALAGAERANPLVAAPVLRGLALAAAVLLAGGAYGLGAERWRGHHRTRTAPRLARGRALVHVGLRLVVCGLLAMLTLMFGLFIPTLGQAAEAMTSIGVACATLLGVWTLWPLQAMHRPSRDHAARGLAWHGPI
jgi:hypothetical protein